VRAVAAEVGISHGLVIHHFGNKKQLIAGLLDWLIDSTSVLHVSEDVARFPLALDRLQALLQPDTFNRTINQPWTQVVLVGLRRVDENIQPGVAFPPDYFPEPDELAAMANTNGAPEDHKSGAPAFFSFGKESSGRRKPLFIGAIAVAILASVAVIGVPAGWYSAKKTAQPATETASAPASENNQTETQTQPQPSNEEAASASEDAAALAARRQREKEKRAREAARAAENSATVAPASRETLKPGAKRVVVTVTYDESGRVVQASGGDANALRIARQKRFPPGKGGTATISIPIN
jgi:AcrR family transcriptional regulator